jgi:hypothetical protein
MSRLEEITPGAAIKGILPDATVSAINAQWFGSKALELTYKKSTRNPTKIRSYEDQ